MGAWIIVAPAHACAAMVAKGEILLPMPTDLPDLENTENTAGLKKRLREHAPHTPPESIATQARILAPLLFEMHQEDIVALHAVHTEEVWLGEITGKRRKTGEGYTMPIRWAEKPVRLSRLRKHKLLFTHTTHGYLRVEAPAARIALRDLIPHRASRFAKWKWAFGIFVFIKISVLLVLKMKSGFSPF